MNRRLTCLQKGLENHHLNRLDNLCAWWRTIYVREGVWRAYDSYWATL